jgi:hypothetical protein
MVVVLCICFYIRFCYPIPGGRGGRGRGGGRGGGPGGPRAVKTGAIQDYQGNKMTFGNDSD